MSGARRRAAAGAAAQTVAGAVARVADRSPLARSPRWSRTNYRGRTVTLAGGVAATVAAAAGAALTGDVRAVGLTLAAGTAGAYDDLVAPGHEARTDKGFRGHLAALRAGRVSGGVVKIVVIGASAWWAVGPVSMGHLDRAVRAVAVAGTANLVNLLDLRPGRAAKVVAAASGPLQWGTAGPLATAAGAAAGAVLPGDLREQTMLGDTGANALGALLGLRAASGPAGLALATAVLTSGLAVLSERVSFSAVIAGHPVLRRLDELGRPDDLDDLDELAARGGSRRVDGPGRRA